MSSIYVISMGPGAEELIAPEAAAALQEAEAVYCADRYRHFVPPEKAFSLTPLSAALDQIEKDAAAGVSSAVLVSGDAGFYSALEMLAGRFGREKLAVIPGISSVSAFCARLGISWQRARLLSAHGRLMSASALCYYVRTNEQTLLLLDGEHDPNWAHDALAAGGLEDVRLTVGERVSFPDEVIGPYEKRGYDALSILLVENDAPEAGLPPVGLSDEAFVRGKTPMTKREIRIQALAEMRLAQDSIVWDIGSGTGSVSVECARQCPLGSVYAVEREEDAMELTRQNARHFHALNVVPVLGEAPEVLAGLPAPTHVFLGGTGGETEAILRVLEGLNADIRVCATAVTVETEAALVRLMGGYEDFSAAQFFIDRIERVGRYHMRRANNPVTVLAATIRGK